MIGPPWSCPLTFEVQHHYIKGSTHDEIRQHVRVDDVRDHNICRLSSGFLRLCCLTYSTMNFTTSITILAINCN
jgi:hypothetical protein